MAVATDRDRFARVLDKRFNPIAYALANGASNVVGLIVPYVMKRELEADATLSAMFREAHRVLVREREAPRLLPDGDYEAERIRARGLESQSAMRLSAAFDDARRCGTELADTLADREVRWMRGSLMTLPDWPDARAAFMALEGEVKTKLAAEHRRRHLGIGDLAVPPAQRTQADILRSSVPVNP
jgi:hypothetical protein